MVVSMKIKNKLVLAFVSVAFIPVSLVAVISVMNTRTQAVEQFIDGSTREIRQIDGNIRQFFDGTLQNVDQMATDPVYTSINTLKNYQPADAPSQPMPAAAQTVIDRFARFGATHPHRSNQRCSARIGNDPLRKAASDRVLVKAG